MSESSFLELFWKQSQVSGLVFLGEGKGLMGWELPVAARRQIIEGLSGEGKLVNSFTGFPQLPGRSFQSKWKSKTVEIGLSRGCSEAMPCAAICVYLRAV
ncbi:MAG: hypothetical protein AAGI38_00810 [Bacteroidota bacterium]